jgi:hypothetical protein
MYALLFIVIGAFMLTLAIPGSNSRFSGALRQSSNGAPGLSMRWPGVGQAMAVYHEAANRASMISTGPAALAYAVGPVDLPALTNQLPVGYRTFYGWQSQIVSAGTDFYVVTTNMIPLPSEADKGTVLRSALAHAMVKPRLSIIQGGLFSNYQPVTGQVQVTALGGIAPIDPFSNAPSQSFAVAVADGSIALATRLRN